MKEKVTVEMDKLTCECMARMVAKEIDLQEELRCRDSKEGRDDLVRTRDEIIARMKEIRSKLDDAGYWYSE